MTDVDPDLSPAAEFVAVLAAAGAHQVDLTTVETARGPMRVSTVLDPASVIYSRPRPYETATFDGAGDWVFGRSARYATREEAQAGHLQMVAKLREEASQ